MAVAFAGLSVAFERDLSVQLAEIFEHTPGLLLMAVMLAAVIRMYLYAEPAR